MTGATRTQGRGRHLVLLFFAVGLLTALTDDRAHANAEPPGRIERIDLKKDGSATKVIIMLSRPLAFEVRVLDGEPARKSARRIVLDFENTTVGPDAAALIKVDDGLVQQVRTGQPAAGKARIVLDLAREAQHDVEAYEAPPHVNVAITDDTPAPTR